MLTITVQLSEDFNSETNEFIVQTFDLELEHSLVSLSKWESKHKKAFLGQDEKTSEEVLSYVEAMILTPEYPRGILEKLSQQNIDKINEYIEDKMTATWFANDNRPKPPARQTITSELVYYWIVSYRIPWDVEYWHLNRLFTLIKVFNENNSKDNKRKVSTREAAAQRHALNQQRLAQHGTRG